MESELTKGQGDIIVNKRKQGPFQNMPNHHWHNGWELYYLLSGERSLLIGGTLHQIKKDTLVLIPPKVIHQTYYSGEKAHERFFVFIPEYVLDPIYEYFGEQRLKAMFEARVFEFPPLLCEEIVRHLNEMYYEWEHKDELSAIAIKSKLMELLILVIRHFEVSNLNLTISHVSDPLIQKVLLEISKDYAKPLTLEEMAEDYGLSTSYFSRKFSAVTGISWKEYLTKVRLQKACELLLETKKQIKEIATLCGYSDSNYFGEVFRKELDISPMNFRKKGKA